MKKIKSLTQLKKEVDLLKKENKRIVFTNGCFDILHPGHIKILRTAKKKGDKLIVGLNRDASIRANKGPGRPILDEKARAEVLSSIEYVDYIVFFSQKTPLKLISQLKPHVVVKGGDWEKKDIVGYGIAEKIYRVALCSGYSTTNIIKKIKQDG